MEGKDIVASLVVIAGTVFGTVQLILYGDGATVTALMGLYGTVLGYYFGRKSTEETKPQ